MKGRPPELNIYLCRHGETEWTLSHQHTGKTDIPLTESGKKQASKMKKRLQGISFDAVFSSPLQRAMKTCMLAGLGDQMQEEPDAVEWDYGEYEGLTSKEIARKDPDWNLFVDGAPRGESLIEVSERADLLLHRISELTGNVAIFSHGHFSRVIAARWLGLDAEAGKYFELSVASVSILGFEHKNPVIQLWNDNSYLSLYRS